jgi:protein involved in polysaccharide export with SLBB domain
MAAADIARHCMRHLGRTLCAMIVFCILGLPVQAQETGDGFADGDILKITAYGREDLTGLYSVQPGPVLSLPLIGIVQLKGHTPRQLETELSTAWENRLGSPMSVTVEFSQRAPFYVMGAVKTPGAYPYRGGLTVLQAIAVSGGMLTGFSNNGTALDVIRERERRLQAVEKLARALTRQARLLAERDGKEQFALPEPFTLLPAEQMTALLVEEARLLDNRAQQYTIKKHLLTDQISLGEAEIASYQQQVKEMDGQQSQLDREANRIKRIPGQQVRAFELNQRSTSLDTAKSSLSSSIVRAKISVETARNGIADMQEAREKEITEALLETGQAIRENELTIAASQDALRAAGVTSPDQGLVFRLVRSGGEEVANVQSTTLIRPGDVLEVGFAPTDAPSQTSAKN